MAAKKRSKPPPKRERRSDTGPKFEAPPKSVGHQRRIVDFAAELQDMRAEMDAIAHAGQARAKELGEHAALLEQTIEEVRSGRLDRAKLLSIASSIATIARLIAERASALGERK